MDRSVSEPIARLRGARPACGPCASNRQHGRQLPRRRPAAEKGVDPIRNRSTGSWITVRESTHANKKGRPYVCNNAHPKPVEQQDCFNSVPCCLRKFFFREYSRGRPYLCL